MLIKSVYQNLLNQIKNNFFFCIFLVFFSVLAMNMNPPLIDLTEESGASDVLMSTYMSRAQTSQERRNRALGALKRARADRNLQSSGVPSNISSRTEAVS
jgi:hypothetical protein